MAWCIPEIRMEGRREGGGRGRREREEGEGEGRERGRGGRKGEGEGREGGGGGRERQGEHYSHTQVRMFYNSYGLHILGILTVKWISQRG